MKKVFYELSTVLLLLCMLIIPAENIQAATSQCPDCNGDGFVTCGRCRGSAEIDCPNCGGSGCTVCGSGYVNCPNCFGGGVVPCENCNGTGSITVPDPKPATKKKNTITVKASVKSITAAKLKHAKRKIKPLSIKKAQGTVTVKKIKKGTSAAIYKKVSVAKKSGVITLSKGKYKKGTYKVRLRITAAGNKSYKKLTKTVTIKFKIK